MVNLKVCQLKKKISPTLLKYMLKVLSVNITLL